MRFAIVFALIACASLASAQVEDLREQIRQKLDNERTRLAFSHLELSLELAEQRIALLELPTSDPTRPELERAYDLAKRAVALVEEALAESHHMTAELRRAMAEMEETLQAANATLELLRNPMSGLFDADEVLLDAEVVFVSEEEEVAKCRLSIGQDADVKPGYYFTVYRGDNFIGRVLIESVEENSSDGRVLFTKPGAKVRVGDIATTRWE